MARSYIFCASDGIGIHKALKMPRLMDCGFESHLAHQRDVESSSLVILECGELSERPVQELP